MRVKTAYLVPTLSLRPTQPPDRPPRVPRLALPLGLGILSLPRLRPTSRRQGSDLMADASPRPGQPTGHLKRPVRRPSFRRLASAVRQWAATCRFPSAPSFRPRFFPSPEPRPTSPVTRGSVVLADREMRTLPGSSTGHSLRPVHQPPFPGYRPRAAVTVRNGTSHSCECLRTKFPKKSASDL